jgi:small-conductance mechanosensitive channel
VDLVTRTLEKVPESLEDILRQPHPKVQFLTFGDSSLDFRLLVWTNKPRSHVQIKSDINYRIAETFRAAGIRLSSRQVEVRIVDGALKLERNIDRLPKIDASDE